MENAALSVLGFRVMKLSSLEDMWKKGVDVGAGVGVAGVGVGGVGVAGVGVAGVGEVGVGLGSVSLRWLSCVAAKYTEAGCGRVEGGEGGEGG